MTTTQFNDRNPEDVRRAIAEAIKSLFDGAERLRRLFPELPFTLDGHSIGGVGAALAWCHFDIEFTKPSTPWHDATTTTTTCGKKKKVEIKATGGTTGIALSADPKGMPT